MKTKRRTKKAKKSLAVLLILTLTITIFPLSGLIDQARAKAGNSTGDVIINYPFNNEDLVGGVDSVQWTDTVVHKGFDSRAYTQAASEKWNGFATDEHAVISDNNVSFYGYDVAPRMDYVFTDLYSSDRINFTMIPQQMIFHTFYQSGFLFNGKMNNGRYTGYALILECSNSEGMLETGIASLKLYYINNELWNTENFKPGNVTNTRTLIATLKEGIQNRTTPVFRVSLELDSVTRAFQLYLDGELRVNVSGSQLHSDATGFGFFTGYYGHNCNILSVIRYEGVYIEGAAEPPPLRTATVKFLLDGGGSVEIRAPETEEGEVYQRYRIVQPKTITYQGETYELTGNSRFIPTNRDIELKYNGDNAQNQTTLYYTKRNIPPGSAPEKDARVNGSDWETGEAEPITVMEGDNIEYRIKADAPSQPQGSVAMVTPGNDISAIDTSWLRQPTTTPRINKQSIKTGTIVNLPANHLTVSAFTSANNNKWREKDIVKAWDATEDTSVNPDRNVKKVFVWLTERATVGTYDMFIGGEGGVWMSASTLQNNQFSNFTDMSTLDLTYFYTGKAKNMNHMFSLCVSLKTLDLSGFDTSDVTDMGFMFNYNGISELDMSGFDTSKVTDMSGMFNGSDAQKMDVSGFNTSNVTNMSNMFNGCKNLLELDIGNFDTSKVLNMRQMFFGSSALKGLNLSNLDTSKVTDVSGMFRSCRALTELNLTTFGTLNAPDTSFMFFDCSSLRRVDMRYFNPIGLSEAMRMLMNCSSLEELHIESINFTSLKVLDDMFTNIKSNINIYVGTTTMETWLTGKVPAGATITVQGPGGTKPTPTPRPPFPYKTIVTDTIPSGLIIDENSITGCNAYKIDGQTIKFYVASLPLEVSVGVTVSSGTSGKLYENMASVKLPGVRPKDTNDTWHVLGTDLPVTQQYYIFDGAGNNQKLAMDNLFNNLEAHMVKPGEDFHLDTGHLPDKLFGYYYYGYQYIKDSSDDPNGTQGEIHQGLPPDPQFINIQSAKTIRYYYSAQPDTVMVTVHFVDKNGTKLLEPITKTVAKGGDYSLSASSLNSFEKSFKTWNFYDSKLTAPGVGNHLNQGEEANRTILQNTPQFTNIQTNQDITLYFTDDPLVTVHFVEYLNEFFMLKSPQTKFVPFNGTFTPADSLRNPITCLGREYKYAERWFTDSGTVLNGDPSPINNISENQEITLCFSTFYSITEKFHKADGNHGKLENDIVIENIPGNFPYTGKPPLVITDSGNEDWHYVGYKVGDNDSTLNHGYPPDPTIEKVNADFTFIYVYEKRTIDSPTAAKDARISEDGGFTWKLPDRGLEEMPEAVKVGDIIEYTITVTDPNAGSSTVPVSPVGFPFSDGVQHFSAPWDGEFLIEVWGAQGGNNGSNQGGLGGYSAGRITLTEDQVLDVYVGGQNGYNGGGDGINGGAKGGGSTDIRPANGNLSSRLLVAGGGGGAGIGNGGAGGGTTGATGGGTSGTPGTGGTQSAGGSSGGVSGQGGSAPAGSSRVYGGGGGGYYGGGAASGNGGTNAQGSGGGGGSAYLGGGLTQSKTIIGNLPTATMPNPDPKGSLIIGNAGNGFVRITPYIIPVPVTSIIDILPTGLKYLSSNPKAEVGKVGDREVLTWDLDGVDFKGRIIIKAEVTGSAKTYLNTASVEIKNKTILTNPTYHRSGLRLTEQYRDKSDLGNVLLDDRETSVSENGNFSGHHPNLIVRKEQNIEKEYRYWGYQIDKGTPIAGIFPGIAADDQHTITYLYVQQSEPVPSGVAAVGGGLLILAILLVLFGQGYIHIRKKMQK